MYLLLLFLAGALVFGIIGYAVGLSLSGLPVASIIPGSKSAGKADQMLILMRSVQIISAIGTFILPALLLAQIELRSIKRYLKLYAPKLLLLALAVVIMLISAPFLEWTIQWNQSMSLPPGLKDLEVWMKQMEEQLAETTKLLLTMHNGWDLAINLLMVAIIPAVGEEFLFRGCLQRILGRWAKNYHVGIWVAAIVFSAIHVQFYGFIPRMLLGALFGYLFVWSNSIWVPVLGHFINNGRAVIGAYILQMQGKSIDELDNVTMDKPWLYVASFIVTIALLIYFYKKRWRTEEQHGE